MILFNKNTSYNLNPLSMPRLRQDELYDIPNVIVRKINESLGVIRFADIIDIAQKNGMTLVEAGQSIIRSHGLEDYVAIVNEDKMYSNDKYYNAVIDSCKYINMQLESSKTIDTSFLEEYINEDIENGNTDNLDIILNETGAVAGLNDFNRTTSADVRQGMLRASNTAKSIKDKVFHWGAKKVLGMADSALQGDNADKAAKIGNTIGKQVVGGVIKGAADAASDELAKVGRKAAAVGILGGGMYVLKNQFMNLTNQERYNRIKRERPFIIKRWLMALKRLLSRLLFRRKKAPQQQQGIITSMISKVHSKISDLSKSLKGEV